MFSCTLNILNTTYLKNRDRQKLKRKNQNTRAVYVVLLVQFLRIAGLSNKYVEYSVGRFSGPLTHFNILLSAMYLEKTFFFQPKFWTKATLEVWKVLSALFRYNRLIDSIIYFNKHAWVLFLCLFTCLNYSPLNFNISFITRASYTMQMENKGKSTPF
jgi:hypothetical protein